MRSVSTQNGGTHVVLFMRSSASYMWKLKQQRDTSVTHLVYHPRSPWPEEPCFFFLTVLMSGFVYICFHMEEAYVDLHNNSRASRGWKSHV